MDFKSHLKSQLSFLERSCSAFDQGYTDEALRIAVVLRVLLHQTKRSTSLLTHMGAENIKLLSTDGTAHPGALLYYGLVTTHISNGHLTYTPNLDSFHDGHKKLIVDEWLNEIVIVLNQETKITRKKLILSAANQDGGAHVDSTLDPVYEALKKEGAFFKQMYLKDGVYVLTDKQPGEIHFMSLRQLGHEILNSQELISLCK
ncbi:hypothetical protein MXM81_11010 [Serratia plymuthica]|uniref:hypothetical protein n=1 Tax=Serratia plymuthica TaxID=82996 RepID=UPI002DBCBB79|nr:hypothetical protein [Serratia plymuthica]MEB6539616.1 hypothetical protein [Serratia plymuthica]